MIWSAQKVKEEDIKTIIPIIDPISGKFYGYLKQNYDTTYALLNIPS